MRVLVTGRSGRLGGYVTADLLAHGHGVVNADRRPLTGENAPGIGADYRYRETDLGDVGQVAGAMAGCDAVVHLGAIPVPYGHADEVVFTQNTGATFAVLQAAALLGVQRAALASSLATLGMAFGPEPAPRYAPVDEAHPLLPADPYGVGKEVDERVGEMFHWQTGMSVAALRFHWVALPDEARAAAKGTEAAPDRGAGAVGVRRYPGRGDGVPVGGRDRGARFRGVRDRRRGHPQPDPDGGAASSLRGGDRATGCDPGHGERVLDGEGGAYAWLRAAPWLAGDVRRET